MKNTPTIPSKSALYCDLSLECDQDLELIGMLLFQEGHIGLHPSIGGFILRALDRRNCYEHLAFGRKLDLRSMSPEDAQLHLEYFQRRLYPESAREE